MTEIPPLGSIILLHQKRPFTASCFHCGLWEEFWLPMEPCRARKAVVSG